MLYYSNHLSFTAYRWNAGESFHASNKARRHISKSHLIDANTCGVPQELHMLQYLQWKNDNNTPSGQQSTADSFTKCVTKMLVRFRCLFCHSLESSCHDVMDVFNPSHRQHVSNQHSPVTPISNYTTQSAHTYKMTQSQISADSNWLKEWRW